MRLARRLRPEEPSDRPGVRRGSIARIIGGQPMRTAEYWHGRADEARVIAEHMVSAEARHTMLDCVREYEDLAKLADRMKLETPLIGDIRVAPGESQHGNRA